MQCGCVSVSLLSSSSAESTTVLSENRQQPVVPDESTAESDDNKHQHCEAKIVQLVAEQASLQQWLKLFVDESAVKRGNIVTKFASMRAVLDSSERAALVAYDDEVRRVVKSVEIESESVEVLAQQLSACVLAFGNGCCDVDVGSEDVESSVESVRSVDVALCEEGLCDLLRACWSLVHVVSDDADEQVLAVATAEVGICDQVSGFG